VHVTAARLRFRLNVKVYVRAAARDGSVKRHEESQW
jgi:hypothetical protein